MGNYVSCTLASAHPRSTTQIMLPTAELRHLGGGGSRTPAADLMLDFPGHFLANSRSLRIGSRFSPLAADEDLEPGNVYVMFPMNRLNSVVNAADMGPLILAAGKAVRRASGGLARVLPDIILHGQMAVAAAQPPPGAAAPMLKVDDGEFEDESVTEFRNRLSLCRSRRPTLETIMEENCACS